MAARLFLATTARRRRRVFSLLQNLSAAAAAAASSSSSESFQCFHIHHKPSAAFNSPPPPPRPSIVPSAALFPYATGRLDHSFRIELLDDDAAAARLWGFSSTTGSTPIGRDDDDDGGGDEPSPSLAADDSLPDFDEIEELRLRRQLFYKLDRGSKEFEENNLDFHKKKRRLAESKRESMKESKNVEKPQNSKSATAAEHLGPKKKRGTVVDGLAAAAEVEEEEKKKTRTPTFNQLTDQFHLPFCLDIYVSKGSVRACVVHRVTSKVVAVAHSISKDMKFDLRSRKDAAACAAVGGVLAQRAIEDDIYNVVYTPRKGERIEGKIQIVLQSIIDNGVDVKVKLKQKKHVKKNMLMILAVESHDNPTT